MLHKPKPRENEFRGTIKNLERQRFWYPVLMLGLLILNIWMAGGKIFGNPSEGKAYLVIIVIGLIYVGTEMLSVKILLIKGEYRDWLREFRKERWTDINSD